MDGNSSGPDVPPDSRCLGIWSLDTSTAGLSLAAISGEMGMTSFDVAEMGSDERDYNNRLSTLTQASARADVLQTVVTELVTDQLRADLEAVHDSVNEGVTAGMSQLADRILDQVFGLE